MSSVGMTVGEYWEEGGSVGAEYWEEGGGG